MKTDEIKRVLVVPNEDGAGPSALLSHVVRRILDTAGTGMEITVWNRSRLAFNRALYEDRPAVRMEPVWNIVELVKDPGSGEVSAPGTLEHLKDYALLRDRYPDSKEMESTDFHVVLDFGVPPAVRWAEKREVPSFTLCDHAWSRTLEMIFDQERLLDGGHGRDGEQLIRALREDEARVRHLFLFPSFLTPPVFRRFWEEIGVRPLDTGAVFGGRPGLSRQEALAFLRIAEQGRTVLVIGGDTPVWDAALLKMASLLAENSELLEERCLNIVIFVPYRLLGHPVVRRLDTDRSTRIRRLEYVPRGTIQEILPAIDLVVTRAGGGMVNDAVACRVPLVCVPERTQPQVGAILDACLEQGLTRRVDPVAFEQDPLRVVLAEVERTDENRGIGERMRSIPTGGEAVVADAVLERLKGCQ